MGVRHKVVETIDAVHLVNSGDSLAVSGFVAQGAPETLLEALGQRFREDGAPANLTVLFGGGPGDFDSKGLNHLAQEGMIRAAVGSHYGQVPKLADLVLQNKILGYALPLGSISRMLRACASNSPGHISQVGLGTFVESTGGKLNQLTVESGPEIVTPITLDGHSYLRYKPFPVRVAFIRGTTADAEGNITFERMSLYADAKMTAMAARSSGGIVVAEVERIAATNSLPTRSVHIPGTFVDAVVLAKPEHRHMSYFTTYNPAWSSEIREPLEAMPKLKLDHRKVIARRATMELRPDDVVNLGIGMPEGVASVASEEGVFQHVTLTTEAGAVGGIGVGGHDFGPASGSEALVEMHQQFDLYNGGGLSVCFLGLAECSESGDVNVSRLSADKLTGPGGFIDITSCTHRVVFMGTFTKKALKTLVGDGKISIAHEGELSTFRTATREVTFSASEALRRGQRVLYVTERAVFELNYRGLKLVEIAPGLDLERDVLAHMEFRPYISDRDGVRTMDPRVFSPEPMGLAEDFTGVTKQMKARLFYKPDTNTLFMDLSHLAIVAEDQIQEIRSKLEKELQRCMHISGESRVNVVVAYDGFDCRADLVDAWAELANYLESNYYASVRRYSGRTFMRQKLGNQLHISTHDEVWAKWTKGGRVLSRAALREALMEDMHINPPAEVLDRFMDGKDVLEESDFRQLRRYLRRHFTGEGTVLTSME